MKFTFALCLVLASAAAPALAVPLAVTVVGPDDKPLPGAQLSVVEGKHPLKSGAQPRAIAGADGLFEFKWDGEFSAAEAAPNAENRGSIWARVAAPGMATQTQLLRQSATTVHLQKGRSFGGLVTDAAQKPAAGVTVELDGWTTRSTTPRDATPRDAAPLPATSHGTSADEKDGATTQSMYVPWVDAWKRAAVTDAAGRWQFDDLPARAQARFTLRSPRFETQNFSVDLDEQEAPPIFVKAGATLTGVALNLDGLPLANVRVGAGWGGDNQTRTDAQGRFTITGIAPGEVALHSVADATDRTPDYLLPALQKVRAVAGETTDVGAWEAVRGVRLEAQLVDEKTKAPIEGAHLRFWNGGGNLSADAQGRIRGRVLPENLREGGQTVGYFNADGYVQTRLAPPTFDENDAVVDLGTVELARGTVVRGRVRVAGEDGKTIANAPNLVLFNFPEDPVWIRLGDASDFVTEALRPGKYQVNLDGNGGPKNQSWEIVSPRNLTVATPYGKSEMAPVEIVLKRLAPPAPLLGLVSGRVTDGDGMGLGGAAIKAILRKGNTYTRAEALTQSDGSFQFERSDPRGAVAFAADGIEIKSIERPGYYWATQPTLETLNGATTVGNLKLKKRGAVFAGRVVGADGRGSAGAWVGVLEMRDYPMVRADAAGKFEMVDVPIEKFTLIGADATGFGRAQTGVDAADFALTLAPIAPSDRAALAARFLENNASSISAQNFWDVLGVERIAAMLEREANEDQRRWAVTQFANELSQRDAAEFMRRAPRLIELAGDQARPALEAKWFAGRAASDDADDRSAANVWLDEQKTAKREINADSVTRLLGLAVVAQKLKRADAVTWLDYAAAVAAQIKSGAQSESRVWGATLAQLGAQTMGPFAEEMKPAVEFNFWWGASIGLARNADIAGARRALARMGTLAQTPALAEQNKRNDGENLAAQIDTARQAIALVMAKTDAADALQMMPESEQSWGRINALLLIADRAIQARDNATAKNALQAAAKLRRGNIEKFALVAALAQGFDPQFAAPLWESALERTVPDKTNDFGGARPSVAMWAYYHARLDAGRSRILIEREWNWRLPAAAEIGEGHYTESYALSQLAMGMAAIDPVRALEMREQARPKIAVLGPAADVALAAALLATPAQSARLGVDEQF